MGARLAIIAGVLAVAVLAGIGYLLFGSDEPGQEEQQRVEAPEPGATSDSPAGTRSGTASETTSSTAVDPTVAPTTSGSATSATDPSAIKESAEETPGEPTVDAEGSGEPQVATQAPATAPRTVAPTDDPDSPATSAVDSPDSGQAPTASGEAAVPQPGSPSGDAGDTQSARLPPDGLSGDGLSGESATGDPGPPQASLPTRTVPSFDVVHVERNGAAVIAGRAEPGSTVIVLRNGEEIGRVETDAAGEWVFLTDRPLAPGDHQLSLRARAPDGSEIEASRLVVVSVPRPEMQVARPTGTSDGAPAASATDEAAAVDASEGPAPRGPVVVALDKSGEGDVVVLQGIDAGVAVGDLVLETLRYDDQGRVTVTGRVTRGSRIFAYIDDTFAGEARGDAEGRWRLVAAEPVSLGLHRLRLDQVDAGGGVVARLETPFARSALMTELAEGERLVVVQPGNSLWRIAQRTYGQGVRYTTIFEANEGQIRDPDLIYPGQVFVVPDNQPPS